MTQQNKHGMDNLQYHIQQDRKTLIIKINLQRVAVLIIIFMILLYSVHQSAAEHRHTINHLIRFIFHISSEHTIRSLKDVSVALVPKKFLFIQIGPQSSQLDKKKKSPHLSCQLANKFTLLRTIKIAGLKQHKQYMPNCIIYNFH